MNNLAAIISHAITGKTVTTGAKDAAQVVHEAGYRCPRVITTLEELEALQDQAVILSTDLEVLICVGKTGSNLWADAWGTWIESVLVTLPARVFWDPTP